MICICGESSDLTCLYGEGVYGGLQFVLQDCVDHAMTLNQFLPCTVTQKHRSTVTESVSMVHRVG